MLLDLSISQTRRVERAAEEHNKQICGIVEASQCRPAKSAGDYGWGCTRKYRLTQRPRRKGQAWPVIRRESAKINMARLISLALGEIAQKSTITTQP